MIGSRNTKFTRSKKTLGYFGQLLAAPSAALWTEVMVNLVIDAAGKVRSAKVEGKPEKDLMDATTDWKFIPAFKDGHPVASRLRLGITPLR